MILFPFICSLKTILRQITNEKEHLNVHFHHGKNLDISCTSQNLMSHRAYIKSKDHRMLRNGDHKMMSRGNTNWSAAKGKENTTESKLTYSLFLFFISHSVLFSMHLYLFVSSWLHYVSVV